MDDIIFSWDAFKEQQEKVRQWRYKKFGGRQKETINIKYIEVGTTNEEINFEEKTDTTCDCNTRIK